MPRSWDHPHADLIADREYESAPRRAQAAVRGRDRVARAGAAALARGGMHAEVVDPSFGDDARKLVTPLAGGYQLHVTPPHPSDLGPGFGSNTWHAAVQPPGVDHHVAGEEVHYAELGAFHPRELHQRVQGYLGRPDVMQAMTHDEDALSGVVTRESRNAEREATIRGIHRDFGLSMGLNPNLNHRQHE